MNKLLINRGFLFLALSVFFLSQATVFAQEGGIEFHDGSWEEALEKSEDKGKPIFVDAYASWCGPCKWMTRNVFTDDEVGDYYNENFINVKLDMEKGEGRTFARKYGVSAYPTLLYLDSEGEVVHKVMGARRTDGFIQEGKKANSFFD